MHRLVERLLHAFGRTSRRSQDAETLILKTDLFDEAFYVQHYGGAFRNTGLSPAAHYYRIGGSAGFEPSARFSGTRYLVDYPDVRGAGINPLVHYLLHGLKEGRQAWPVPPIAARPARPSAAAWNELEAKLREAGKLSAGVAASINVVIHASNGFDEIANFFYRVLQSRLANKLKFDVIVIRDPPPFSDLSPLLDDLQRRGLITIAANKMMQLNTACDVVLLDPHTEVFVDWIDRLHRAAYSESDIGTVTPFSNNAGIYSYPYPAGSLEEALETPFEQLGDIARRVNAGLKAEIPSAAGFCVYVKRDWLQQCGPFDSRPFETLDRTLVDFSLKAAAAGWRNVLAADVFVRHFGRPIPERRTEVKTDFEKNDPLRPLKRNIDVTRLQAVSAPSTFLFVFHNVGGGTLRHINDMTAGLEQEGIGVLWMQPGRGGHGATLAHPRVSSLSAALHWEISDDEIGDAVAVLKQLGVMHIHVHHTLGFDLRFPQWLTEVAKRCGIAYDVTIHDYFMQCPRVFMVDGSGTFCGGVCDRCLATPGAPVVVTNLAAWRHKYRDFVQAARRRFVPNKAIRAHLSALGDPRDFYVREHPEAIPSALPEPIAREAQEELRVAIIGATFLHKGSRVLLECARDARLRNLPIVFHLFGYSDLAELEQMPNVLVSGKYDEHDLPALLRDARCQIAFFPAVWPETYSYTLTQAWLAGLYPVAFDMGAIAERIRRAEWGHMLPTDMIANAPAINDTLLLLRPSSRPTNFGKRIPVGHYDNLLRNYYGMEQMLTGAERADRAQHAVPDQT